MWEKDWALKSVRTKETRIASQVDAATIEAAYLLHWQEHCLECAVPDCYRTCSLYVERADQKCARLRDGIVPNYQYDGPLGYGAEVSFRRWGKLESRLWFGSVSPTGLRRLDRLDTILLRGLVRPVSNLLRPLNPKRRVSRAYSRVRNRALQMISGKSAEADLGFDSFLMEAWNPSEESFNVILECFQNDVGGNRGDLAFRRSLPLAPGHNLHRIPMSEMQIDLGRADGRVLVYPENDAEVRVIFTWLDLVRTAAPPSPKGQPAPLVKCVVWDLDHTLWDGILIEDGPEAVRVKPEAEKLIRALDEKGIIQSIASKNDHQLAWKRLEEAGLEKYFLHPAINWGPKSENIKQVAEALNINVDTFAFIDDSAFERSEVESRLPQVRCFNETEIPNLLAQPEFDVPVTEASRKRRESYQAEAERREIAQRFGDDYLEFLSSCGMEATLFVPREQKDIDRCFELLQRSNQLNLTTRRYGREELLACFDDPNRLCVATQCRDKFGEYGTVGFATIRLGGEHPVMEDFVLSCRVAQKRVEHAWFGWLQGVMKARGQDRIRATFRSTERNGVLRQVLGEVGFVKWQEERDGEELLELALATPPPGAEIVTIRDEVSSDERRT